MAVRKRAVATPGSGGRDPAPAPAGGLRKLDDRGRLIGDGVRRPLGEAKAGSLDVRGDRGQPLVRGEPGCCCLVVLCARTSA
jgi:hypothetical protein